MGEMMKAVYGDKTNKGKLKVGERPRPAAKGANVLVEVHAACINPVDWKTQGRIEALHKLPLPLPEVGIGFDLAGVVVEKGPKAMGIEIGDEVYAMGPWPGSYAEFVTVPARCVVPKPKNLDFQKAAACPMACLTAYQSFKSVNLNAGEKILIIGGSGGVGSFAVQIAKSMGAEVSAVCSTVNVELVSRLGADKVIDYRQENFLEEIEDVKSRYDVIYDCVGNESIKTCKGILKSNGRFVSIANNAQNRKEIALSYVNKLLPGDHNMSKTLLALPIKRHLNKMTKLIEEERIVPTIDSVFNIDEALAALEHSQSGRAKGKIVIAVK